MSSLTQRVDACKQKMKVMKACDRGREIFLRYVQLRDVASPENGRDESFKAIRADYHSHVNDARLGKHRFAAYFLDSRLQVAHRLVGLKINFNSQK